MRYLEAVTRSYIGNASTTGLVNGRAKIESDDCVPKIAHAFKKQYFVSRVRSLTRVTNRHRGTTILTLLRAH